MHPAPFSSKRYLWGSGSTRHFLSVQVAATPSSVFQEPKPPQCAFLPFLNPFLSFQVVVPATNIGQQIYLHIEVNLKVDT